AGGDHYLVHTKRAGARPVVTAFCAWMRDETRDLRGSWDGLQTSALETSHLAGRGLTPRRTRKASARGRRRSSRGLPPSATARLTIQPRGLHTLRGVDSNRRTAVAHRMRLRTFSLAILVCGLIVASRTAEGRITKLVVTTVQSPTFAGTTFGSVGAYEKIAGRAFGEVDPSDPRNATITDLAFAPRNSAGMVESSIDVYLLKP